MGIDPRQFGIKQSELLGNQTVRDEVVKDPSTYLLEIGQSPSFAAGAAVTRRVLGELAAPETTEPTDSGTQETPKARPKLSDDRDILAALAITDGEPSERPVRARVARGPQPPSAYGDELRRIALWGENKSPRNSRAG